MLTVAQALALVMGEFGQDRPFGARDLLDARHPALQDVGLSERPFRYVLDRPHGGLVLVREGRAFRVVSADQSPLVRRAADLADKLGSGYNQKLSNNDSK